MIKHIRNRALVFIAACLILLGSPVAAQILPSLESLPGKTSAPQLIPTFRQGNIEVSPVFLDGKAISLISGEIDIGSNTSKQSKLTAQERSFIVHGKLQRVLEGMNRYSAQLARDGITGIERQREMLKSQLRITTDKRAGGISILLAFPRDDPPELIVTTTSADVARIRSGSSVPDEIAKRSIVSATSLLLDAWQERQKPYLISTLQQSLVVLGALIVLSIAMISGRRKVRKRLDAIMLSHNRRLDCVHFIENGNSDISKPGRLQRRQKILRRAKVSLLTLWLSLLYWGQWMLWMVGAAWLAGKFFFSRPAGNFIVGVSIKELERTITDRGARFAPLDWLMSLGTEAKIGLPLLILLVCMGMQVAIRLGNTLCDFYVVNWLNNQTTERMRFRVPTLASALKAWFTITVYILVGMIIFYHLYELGAFTQSVAIILGFFSFALSLASQNLIRDLINGLLILTEDQLAVGDVVIIGEHAGLVERMTLRVTQLRNLDGELISIPNGIIGVIKNLTSSWSRVNYTIQVAVSEDIDRAMNVISNVANELFADPDWSDRILEAPELLGVDEIDHQGVLIRILIKTKPFEQWPVGREFRRRLKMALDHTGISVGAPRLELLQLSSLRDAQ